jgi:hypothetical protein
MKRRRRRFGAPEAIHREKADHAFRDAIHHAGLVHEEENSCHDALEDLLIAKGAEEEGTAHAGGADGGRLGRTARRAVYSAERKFATRCLCGKKGD